MKDSILHIHWNPDWSHQWWLHQIPDPQEPIQKGVGWTARPIKYTLLSVLQLHLAFTEILSKQIHQWVWVMSKSQTIHSMTIWDTRTTSCASRTSHRDWSKYNHRTEYQLMLPLFIKIFHPVCHVSVLQNDEPDSISERQKPVSSMLKSTASRNRECKKSLIAEDTTTTSNTFSVGKDFVLSTTHGHPGPILRISWWTDKWDWSQIPWCSLKKDIGGPV